MAIAIIAVPHRTDALRRAVEVNTRTTRQRRAGRALQILAYFGQRDDPELAEAARQQATADMRAAGWL